jgi:hypothetical protein
MRLTERHPNPGTSLLILATAERISAFKITVKFTLVDTITVRKLTQRQQQFYSQELKT